MNVYPFFRASSGCRHSQIILVITEHETEVILLYAELFDHVAFLFPFHNKLDIHESFFAACPCCDFSLTAYGIYLWVRDTSLACYTRLC